jgi:hypothetical protein
MKKDMLARLVGFHLRLRPVLRRFDMFGELEPEDDRWIVERAHQGGLDLLDVRTYHVLTIPPDHIHEFRFDSSPYFPNIPTGFLMLRSQVWLQGQRAGLEPLDWSYQGRGF